MWYEYATWVQRTKNVEIQGLVLASLVIFAAFCLGMALSMAVDWVSNTRAPRPSIATIRASRLEIVPVTVVAMRPRPVVWTPHWSDLLASAGAARVMR
jgi:hypothetical protein